MRLLLASRALPGLASFLGPPARVAFVPTAANHLGEPDIAEEVRGLLRSLGHTVVDVDVEAVPAGDLDGGDALVVGGGDPFHLLGCARAAGLAEAVHRRSLPYVGISAGAIVAGPSLRPVTLTSPFTAPEGFDLRGLGLTRYVVLPHEDRPGRRRKNQRALNRFGAEFPIIRLRDDQAALVEDETVVVLAEAGGAPAQ